MDSGGNISWMAKLCGGFDSLCLEARDILPEDPIEHVRDQFLTAGERLKKFYLDLKKDVFPIFRKNHPTSPKQEEYSSLLHENKSTASTNDSQERISEAVESLSPGDDVHISLVPKRETGIRIRRSVLQEKFKSDIASMLDSPHRGLTPEEVENFACSQLEALISQCIEVASLDDGDGISGSQFTTEIDQEYEVSYAHTELLAPVKPLVFGSFDDANDIDNKFSTEIQEYRAPSSGENEYDACPKLSATLKSLVVGSSNNIGDTSNILASEFSTEIQDYNAPDKSSEAIHSIHKDSILFGRELQAELIRLGFLDPDSGSVQSEDVDSSQETEESDNLPVFECSTEEYEATESSSVSTVSISIGTDFSYTMFGDKLQSGLLASDSDISDYSSSEETSDSDDALTRPIEGQKLNDIKETSKRPLSDMKFVEERSCETASQDREWERLNEDFSDSDWEIV